jgi:hypothetical protein
MQRGFRACIAAVLADVNELQRRQAAMAKAAAKRGARRGNWTLNNGNRCKRAVAWGYENGNDPKRWLVRTTRFSRGDCVARSGRQEARPDDQMYLGPAT